ncbi:MAG: hypothetical protein K8I60_19005 [Anaerolineae bacterium]|nr:hypothetical protein [Anaerolineae bacterium]
MTVIRQKNLMQLIVAYGGVIVSNLVFIFYLKVRLSEYRYGDLLGFLVIFFYILLFFQAVVIVRGDPYWHQIGTTFRGMLLAIRWIGPITFVYLLSTIAIPIGGLIAGFVSSVSLLFIGFGLLFFCPMITASAVMSIIYGIIGN